MIQLLNSCSKDKTKSARPFLKIENLMPGLNQVEPNLLKSLATIQLCSLIIQYICTSKNLNNMAFYFKSLSLGPNA